MSRLRLYKILNTNPARLGNLVEDAPGAAASLSTEGLELNVNVEPVDVSGTSWGTEELSQMTNTRRIL